MGKKRLIIVVIAGLVNVAAAAYLYLYSTTAGQSVEFLKLMELGMAMLGLVTFVGGGVALVNKVEVGYRRVRVKRIRNVPGTKLLLIVDFFYSPKAVEETFKPTIADWHAEYFEALKQEKFLKARWISVRYTYRFVLAMGLSQVFSIIKSFRSVIK